MEKLCNLAGICSKCLEPYQHDLEEPFAYCKCGCSEWAFIDITKEPLSIQRDYYHHSLTTARARIAELEGALESVRSLTKAEEGDHECLTCSNVNARVAALSTQAPSK